MNDKVVKEALSYALGSDLHEAWRLPRKKEDGTFEPRIKKSNDEAWNSSHGTDKVDIANYTFEELPSNWQYENLEAARVAIELVYDKTMASEQITPKELEQLAAIIHEEWLKRNSYVFGPIEQGGRPDLAVPYEKLDPIEKEKDKVQIVAAQTKVQAYMNGLIDIASICEQYGIQSSGKRL